MIIILWRCRKFKVKALEKENILSSMVFVSYELHKELKTWLNIETLLGFYHLLRKEIEYVYV